MRKLIAVLFLLSASMHAATKATASIRTVTYDGTTATVYYLLQSSGLAPNWTADAVLTVNVTSPSALTAAIKSDSVSRLAAASIVLSATDIMVVGTIASQGTDMYTYTGAYSAATHAASHQNGGTDEVSTSTPAANAIPKAGAGGTLAAGWIPTLNQNTTGSAASLSGATFAAPGPIGSTTPGSAVHTTIALTALLISNAAPAISSGFGTTPSVSANNGTAAFRVNVGTGGVATSGVIGLPTATTGWNCFCNTITTQSATVFLCKQTASTTTTATIGNFTTAGAAGAWVASNIVSVSCFGY